MLARDTREVGSGYADEQEDWKSIIFEDRNRASSPSLNFSYRY